VSGDAAVKRYYRAGVDVEVDSLEVVFSVSLPPCFFAFILLFEVSVVLLPAVSVFVVVDVLSVVRFLP
jgi:hypothetical protein